MGSAETSNKRTICQFIHPSVLKTCQLSMGMTMLEPGSVWNTMPAHTHERRMEIYTYFDIPEGNVVFHFMGESNQTRHVVMHNGQAVINPSWSIHSGAGTANYSFIGRWAAKTRPSTIWMALLPQICAKAWGLTIFGSPPEWPAQEATPGIFLPLLSIEAANIHCA